MTIIENYNSQKRFPVAKIIRCTEISILILKLELTFSRNKLNCIRESKRHNHSEGNELSLTLIKDILWNLLLQIIRDMRRPSSHYVTRGRLRFRFAQVLVNAVALMAIAGGLAAYFKCKSFFKIINIKNFIN